MSIILLCVGLDNKKKHRRRSRVTCLWYYKLFLCSLDPHPCYGGSLIWITLHDLKFLVELNFVYLAGPGIMFNELLAPNILNLSLILSPTSCILHYLLYIFSADFVVVLCLGRPPTTIKFLRLSFMSLAVNLCDICMRKKEKGKNTITFLEVLRNNNVYFLF